MLSGEFTIFSSARGDITIDAVVASAAVPNLFRAVRVDGRLCWDGLLSQNPPVRELPDARPDEIWVIQINPPHAGRSRRRWRTSWTAATSLPATGGRVPGAPLPAGT